MTGNERIVCIFALRYSFGRKTFAFSEVTGYISSKLDEFTKHDLEQMAEEIRDATVSYDLAEWQQRKYIAVADKFLEKAGKKNESKADVSYT